MISVLELDDTVTAHRILQLPTGVKCVFPDGEFLYAGCDDGQLYGMSMCVFLQDLWLPQKGCQKDFSIHDFLKLVRN